MLKVNTHCVQNYPSNACNHYWPKTPLDIRVERELKDKKAET